MDRHAFEKGHSFDWRNFVCGAIARATTTVTLYPLDLAKTRLQTNSCSTIQNGILQGQLRSVLDCLKKILATDGFRGLYRGLSPKLVYILPSGALSFTIYEQMKGVTTGQTSPWTPILLFSTARLFGTFSRTPFDLIKTHLQVGPVGSTSSASTSSVKAMDVLRRVVRTEGYLGIFSGFGPTLARDIPFACLYFLMYESGKFWIRRMISSSDDGRYKQSVFETLKVSQSNPGHVSPPTNALDSKLGPCISSNATSPLNLVPVSASSPTSNGHPNGHLHLPPIFIPISGAFAGASATLLTIPLDVVKTKVQSGKYPEYRKNGVIYSLKHIFKYEGIHGLTKGLGSRFMMIIPASAINFTIYEFLKVVFEEF